MCTLSFIPLGNRVLIAHNRDESINRKKAIAPSRYNINGCTVLFPKDGNAGGSWVGCNQFGSAAMLLNGAFEKHTYHPPYRKSRGLIFLDILATENIYHSCDTIDLKGIEPFTIILWTNNKLYECRWDGEQRFIRQLNSTAAHTWSSVTLYNKTMFAKRQQWFRGWLNTHPEPTLADLLQFHLTGGEGDSSVDLRMNRNDLLATVSVTTMEIITGKVTMSYLDLQDDNNTTDELLFIKAASTI